MGVDKLKSGLSGSDSAPDVCRPEGLDDVMSVFDNISDILRFPFIEE